VPGSSLCLGACVLADPRVLTAACAALPHKLNHAPQTRDVVVYRLVTCGTVRHWRWRRCDRPRGLQTHLLAQDRATVHSACACGVPCCIACCLWHTQVEEKIYRKQVFKSGLSKAGMEEGIQLR
jgi:hypothetical protein